MIQAKGLEVQTDHQDTSCYSYEAVTPGCPACRMQICAGLSTYYREIPAYHPVELLAISFAQREGNDGEKTGNTEEITEGQVWRRNGT